MKTEPAANDVSLRRALTLITLGGGLFMLHMVFINSPLTTAFFDSIGANEFHFGLLGGIPMLMLSMLFVGAFINNRLRRRKPTFMIVFIMARLLYLPVAFLPLILKSVSSEVILMLIILIIGLYTALSNVGEVAWMSWMADLIPHRILNTYFGVRQQWVFFPTLLGYGTVAAFTHYSDLPITTKFPILATAGVIAGIIDILLFIRIREPVHQVVRDRNMFSVLLEPIRHRDYRTLLLFQCVFMSAVAILIAFSWIYALNVLHVSVAQLTLLVCVHVAGTALSSRAWGKLADKHGHRPVLSLCFVLKPALALTFLLATPDTVLWILPPVMVLDGLLNGGLHTAFRGYIMKRSPRENRSMFVAAALGLSGICAGLAAIAAGVLLRHIGDWSIVLLGRKWINYQVIFAISFIMRVGCIFLVRTIREPTSSPPGDLLRDMLPWRWSRAPADIEGDR